MPSLRTRAWISGSLTAVAAVALGTALLYSYLGRKAQERFDRALIVQHTQLVAVLNGTADDPDRRVLRVHPAPL